MKSVPESPASVHVKLPRHTWVNVSSASRFPTLDSPVGAGPVGAGLAEGVDGSPRSRSPQWQEQANPSAPARKWSQGCCQKVASHWTSTVEDKPVRSRINNIHRIHILNEIDIKVIIELFYIFIYLLIWKVFYAILMSLTVVKIIFRPIHRTCLFVKFHPISYLNNLWITCTSDSFHACTWISCWNAHTFCSVDFAHTWQKFYTVNCLQFVIKWYWQIS